MSRKYALFVGNCDYDSESLSNLKSPISDVKDLANLFRDSSIGGFNDVTELINSTESKIRQLISSFFLHKKPEDLLLLYFSGHGILDDKGDLYLAAKDTQPDLLRATAISADFIADDMDRCRSKRQILILDCCHSGAFRRGIKGDDKVLTANTFEGNGSGRIVLTASDRREFAMEGNQVLKNSKTSLFTHFLLEGLKSGDADKDGDSLITLDEWYDYAYDKVVENLSTQTPRRWVYNQEGRLIIARNPKPIKPAELAWELREAIQDDHPSIRLGAISELANILNGPNKRQSIAARNALMSLLIDDSPEVRERADRILEGKESANSGNPSIPEDSVDENLTGLNRIGTKLLSVFGTLTIAQRRSYMIAIVLITVGLVGGGLFILTNTNPVNGGDENFLTEQADIGTLGMIDTSLEESNPNEDIQEPSTSTENQQPDIQESNSQQPPPSSSDDESKAGEGDTQPQENVTTPNDESLVENEDPVVTDSDPATGRDEHQNPPSVGQLVEKSIIDTGEDLVSNMESPLERLETESVDLQNILVVAIKERQWVNVPDPFVKYYYEESNLETLYSAFNIIEVESSSGELQSDEATVTLRVVVHISYQQKGREDLQKLSIPANWEWEKDDDGFMLTNIYKP